jgi:CBS domain-containing protein
MKTVRQLLEIKGNGVISITPGASVFDALVVMAEQQVGALLVMEGASLVGIFSERDYAREVALKGKTSRDTAIREVMTPQSALITVSPDETVENCMALISNKRIRHLPVLENGRVAGVLSIGDLVKETIAYQHFLIEQLERYIKS